MPTAIEINTTTVLWAIGAIASIVAVTVAATWHLRKDRLEELQEKLNVLTEAKDWKLPDTLRSLNLLSEKLNLQLEEKAKVDSLMSENEALTKSNRDLQIEVSDLKESAAKLETSLKNMLVDSQEIEVAKGETQDLIKNTVAVGVKGIYDPSVEITINNDNRKMQVGNTIEIPFANKICVLRFRTIKKGMPDKAVFSFGLRDL